jgi:hypothetical protein
MHQIDDQFIEVLNRFQTTTHNLIIITIVTLTLGSRPKQGLTKVRAKYEARESHFIFLGVQGSARECEGMNLHTPK